MAEEYEGYVAARGFRADGVQYTRGQPTPIEEITNAQLLHQGGYVVHSSTPDGQAAMREYEQYQSLTQPTDGAIEAAEELDVNLEEVEGTGQNGRITKRDVEQHYNQQLDEEERQAQERDAEPPAGDPTQQPVEQVAATDSARSLAAQHGISLADLTGSGSGGQIIQADVKQAIEARQAEHQPAPQDDQPNDGGPEHQADEQATEPAVEPTVEPVAGPAEQEHQEGQ